MIKQCANCKWWDKWDSEWCECNRMNRAGYKMRPSEDFIATDESNFDITIQTTADFGCVQWEKGEMNG